jgi:predicted transcriptional regulator
MQKAKTKRDAMGRRGKLNALAAIQSLPANATIEDAIERLVLLAKIDRGLADARNGKTIDHAEVKRRLLR